MYWSGEAYKITKERAMEYNRCVEAERRIPDRIIDRMKDGEEYAVAYADVLGSTLQEDRNGLSG